MGKVILILDGIREGKIKFIETIKNNNYFKWNISSKNFLSMFACKLGFDGEKDSKFFDFTAEFEEVVNKYYNFEIDYIEKIIQKFLNRPNPTVLIIHNCKPSISKLLQNKYENCFNVLITDNDKENNNYCKNLNYLDDDFEESVLKVLRILTKDIGENNEI